MTLIPTYAKKTYVSYWEL